MRLLICVSFVVIYNWSYGFASDNVEKVSWKDHVETHAFHQEHYTPDKKAKLLSGFSNCSIVQDESEGLCYGEITCRRLKGKLTGYCSGLDGACCVFYRTCGGRTSQEISHFRNEEWPLEERMKETCSFSVKKRDSKICGLQIDLEKLNIPGYVGKCTNTFLWITGVPRQRIELICGDFSGSSYFLNITSTTEMFIKIKSYSGYISSWSISVKQIASLDFEFEKLPIPGEGKMITTTEPPVEESVTEISGPSYEGVSTSYSQCGIRGRPRDLANSKTMKFLTKSTSLSTEDGGNEDDVTTTDVKWMVPELTDTTFYMYQGTTGLLGQRITYGQIAGEMEFPWQVAIFIGRSFHCGGSIIGGRYILTAAHCVWSYKTRPGILRIVLGKYDISKSYQAEDDDIDVDIVRPHPEYSRRTLENDVAVLKLSKEIIFNERIRPICLPPADIEPEGELSIVTGWGRDENHHLVTKLHKLQSAIIDNKVCDERWGDKGAQSGFIEPTMVCMDVQNGDSCNGDSGGPSVIEDPTDPSKYIQIGIVSFGSGSCTDKNLPGVYTRVPSFVDWINKQLH